MSDEEDFEEQLRLEQVEQQSKEVNEIIEHGRVRKDDDGTEFEWDAEKKAWFPKITEDFIANYQMNYGATNVQNNASSTTPNSSNPPPEVATDPAAYWKYYYGDKPPHTNDPNYPAWYQYFYGQQKSTAESAGGEAGSEAEGPKLGDPEYPRWYYKQCYGVEPDETNEQYLVWAKGLAKSPEKMVNEPSDKNVEETSVPEATSPTVKEEATAESSDKGPKAKKKKPDPKWFDQGDEHNTSVYVQGLPDDITEDEFKDFMSKCGLIAFDYDRKKLKLKLYMDKDTEKPKGDGLCTYIKKESVDLALQLLDDSDIRGSKIEVTPAKFELKGAFDPKLRRKPKNNKLKRREKEKHSKLLDWRPDKLPDERFTCEKTVVLKNLFDPKDFDKNPAAIQEVREDVRQECSKYGDIKKITVYDRNADGVTTIAYKEFEAADLCVAGLHQRWFGGRRILASNWNGKDKFEVKETAEQEAERLRKWNEYLEMGGSRDEQSPKP